MECQDGRMVDRLIGVEEELLLTDAVSGIVTAVSNRALQAHMVRSQQPESAASREPAPESARADIAQVEHELFLEQLETATPPCRGLDDLERELCRGRLAVLDAARAAGATAVAAATPVLVEDTEVTPKRRYLRMMREFGETARDSLVCGMHVHIAVSDPDEAVAVLDRMRPWFPVLLAMSANSPFWHGTDTGYASWRWQVMRRWPTAGDVEPFGDFAGYRSAVEDLLASGAAMDQGMLYFDARPSASYPTLEVRVADVCTEIKDAVLLAALSRALVEASGRAWRRGELPSSWRTELLRAAHWRAARDGLSGQLIHPLTRRLAPARDVVAALCSYARPALVDTDEVGAVNELVDDLFRRGDGASRQRAVMQHHDDLRSVVADLQTRTRDSCDRS
jgi:carboxylate-amine ligase